MDAKAGTEVKVDLTIRKFKVGANGKKEEIPYETVKLKDVGFIVEPGEPILELVQQEGEEDAAN